jgi:hypothetical protein
MRILVLEACGLHTGDTEKMDVRIDDRFYGEARTGVIRALS